MARYALIDGYLDTMRTEIRWRRDLDDLVSEMEDHLYSTVENLRPIVPAGHSRETLVLWLRGRYTSYTDYQTEVVAYTE